MTDTLKFDPTKSQTLEFAVEVDGETSPVKARLTMEADGILHSFQGVVEDGLVRIIIPKLSGLIKQDVVQSRLEILVGEGDGHRYFVPSKFAVELERGTRVTAGGPTLLQEELIEEEPATPEEVSTTPTVKIEEPENIIPIVTPTEPSGQELTLESLGIDPADVDLDDEEPLLPPTREELAARGKELQKLARAKRRFKR